MTTEPTRQQAAGSSPAETGAATTPVAPPRPPRSAMVMFMTTILALEAFVMLFASLVAHGLRAAPLPWVWAVGGTAMALCIVGAGLARKYPRQVAVLGWMVQLGLAAVAFVVPLVLGLAIVFALLWLIALRTGADIDAERQVRYAAELEHHRAAEADGAA